MKPYYSSTRKSSRRSSKSKVKSTKTNDLYAKTYSYTIPTPKSRRSVSTLSVQAKLTTLSTNPTPPELSPADDTLSVKHGMNVVTPAVAKSPPEEIAASTLQTNKVPNPYLKPKPLQTPTQAMLDEDDDYNSNELLAASTLGALSHIEPSSLFDPGNDLMFGAVDGLAKLNQETIDTKADTDTLTVHELGRNSWEHMPTQEKRSLAAKHGLNIGRYEEMKDVANALLESEASSFVAATTQPPSIDTTNANPPLPPTDSTKNTDPSDTDLVEFLGKDILDGEFTLDDEVDKAIARIRAHEEETGDKYLAATSYSARHESTRLKLLNDLMSVVSNNKEVFGALTSVEKRFDGQLFPRLFYAVAGTPSPKKCQLTSSLLWFYSLSLKNERAEPNGCPYVQPSTHMMKIRAILGMMRQDFGWEFSLDEHFKFTGGLEGRLKQLFAERAEEYPIVSLIL